MRMAFGLVGLLVTVGVMIWIMASFYLPYTKASLDIKKSLEPDLAIISLQGAPDQIKTAPYPASGQTTGLTVTAIAIGGLLNQYYGLVPGDVVVEVGPFTVRDDPEMARLQLIEAPRSQHRLIVLRGGQRLTLDPTNLPTRARNILSKNPQPSPTASATPAPAATPAATPAPAPTAPPAPPPPSDGALQKQVDILQQIPGLR